MCTDRPKLPRAKTLVTSWRAASRRPHFSGLLTLWRMLQNSSRCIAEKHCSGVFCGQFCACMPGKHWLCEPIASRLHIAVQWAETNCQAQRRAYSLVDVSGPRQDPVFGECGGFTSRAVGTPPCAWRMGTHLTIAHFPLLRRRVLTNDVRRGSIVCRCSGGMRGGGATLN